MRLSVSISEQLGKTVKNVAENEKKSVSSLTAEALFYYLQEKKKKNSVINCWRWQASRKSPGIYTSFLKKAEWIIMIGLDTGFLLSY
jgi:hypothetical protein